MTADSSARSDCKGREDGRAMTTHKTTQRTKWRSRIRSYWSYWRVVSPIPDGFSTAGVSSSRGEMMLGKKAIPVKTPTSTQATGREDVGIFFEEEFGVCRLFGLVYTTCGWFWVVVSKLQRTRRSKARESWRATAQDGKWWGKGLLLGGF